MDWVLSISNMNAAVPVGFRFVSRQLLLKAFDDILAGGKSLLTVSGGDSHDQIDVPYFILISVLSFPVP